MFFLVDANSFYVSCEAVFDPAIRNRPVVVLTNNDGQICAANRQAKALNISKFAPYFKVKELCKLHNVVVKSSNYELYADLSNKMMNVIGRFAHDQYIYSIDESFLRLTNYHQIIDDLHAYGTKIRRTVYKETRLPVCVGVAPTPTLAKAANNMAKKLARFRGVIVINDEQTRKDLLSQMPVADVWGVGRKISARLKLNNIHTALDLANWPVGLARKEFNIEVERTVRELNGEQCMSWEEVRAPKKQIFSTRSFGNRVTKRHELQQALNEHVSIAVRKLRKQSSLVRYMTMFASSSPHDESPTYRRAFHRFVSPTNDTSIVMQALSDAMDSLFVKNVRYYRVGIGLIDLVDQKFLQGDLFNPSQDNYKLMDCLDSINHRFGDNTLQFASQGFDKKWAMRRQFMSPKYTTNWADIPKIKC